MNFKNSESDCFVIKHAIVQLNKTTKITPIKNSKINNKASITCPHFLLEQSNLLQYSKLQHICQVFYKIIT